MLINLHFLNTTYVRFTLLMFYEDNGKHSEGLPNLPSAKQYLWSKQPRKESARGAVCPTNTVPRWASSAVGVVTSKVRCASYHHHHCKNC